jgi:hypothetical protein
MLFTVEVLAIHVTAEIVYPLKFSIASTDWCYEFAFYSIQYLFLLWLEAKFAPFCRPLSTWRRLVETRLDAWRLSALDLFGYCTVHTLRTMYGPIENLACASLANT